MDLDPAAITPDDSPLTIDDVIASEAYLDMMTPKRALADRAADFTLPTLDGGAEVTLSAFAGSQPVALIFGSYT
jgi:hypothetical protein